MNYYNEHDPKAAAWLRELVRCGHIAPGDVDERSIADVKPTDLRGYVQCHFFAGIGGWSLALRLAGWSDDKEVWTGSCPCQPFSVAGKGLGAKDPRHLWPVFRRLVGRCRPSVVFGEQVASAAGRLWLAGVRANLARLGYALGSADLCAASAGEEGEGWIVRGDITTTERLVIGAPHIRQRLYWVAKSEGERFTREQAPWSRRAGIAHGGWMGSPIQQGLEGQPGNGDGGSQPGRLEAQPHGPVAETGAVGGVGKPPADGCEVRPQLHGELHREGFGEGRRHGAWSHFDILPCRDGKARRVESGVKPLVAGLPKGMVHSGYPGLPFDPQACAEGRVMRLRGYGNSIVPQLAAQFIQAYLETKG